MSHIAETTLLRSLIAWGSEDLLVQHFIFSLLLKQTLLSAHARSA